MGWVYFFVFYFRKIFTKNWISKPSLGSDSCFKVLLIVACVFKFFITIFLPFKLFISKRLIYINLMRWWKNKLKICDGQKTVEQRFSFVTLAVYNARHCVHDICEAYCLYLWKWNVRNKYCFPKWDYWQYRKKSKYIYIYKQYWEIEEK